MDGTRVGARQGRVAVRGALGVHKGQLTTVLVPNSLLRTPVKHLGKMKSKLCIAQSTHTAHSTPRDKLAELFQDCKMEFMPTISDLSLSNK